MKRYMILCFVLYSVTILSQEPEKQVLFNSSTNNTENLNDQLIDLLEEIKITENMVNDAFKKFSKEDALQSNKIDSQFNLIISHTKEIKRNYSDLESQLNKSVTKADRQTGQAGNTSRYISLIWYIIVILLIISGLLVNILLFRFQKLFYSSQERAFNSRFESFEKIVSKIESGGDLKDTKVSTQSKNSERKIEENIDHAFHLQLANELSRLRNNLYYMNENTKGKKQLLAGVDRIQSNLESKGYEIVQMLNQPYNEGMKAEATFVANATLSPGERIISKIYNPQVNYKGTMLQHAKIEVSERV